MTAKGGKVQRPWSSQSERKLGRLVSLVEAASAREGADPGAAVQVAVLEMTKAKDVKDLADRLGLDRTQLSRCLRGRQLLRDIRRRLDSELGLPPGGMERVLSLVEDIPEPAEG